MGLYGDDEEYDQPGHPLSPTGWPLNPDAPEPTAAEFEVWRREDQERQEAEQRRTAEFWAEQKELPLRERHAMWWAGVALPNVILTAVVVATVLWVVGVL